ncbi:sodium/proline symporter [Candidatus Dependentiae bacterium]|nr:sodium/proline symporter [Candidatus Dependentiae bacterium]
MLNGMIIAFSLYFIILLLIGLYFYNKNKNMSDYSLANRSLNFWLTAISAQASDMSDWLFMAYPGLIFSQGLSQIWIAVGLVLFMFLTWHYIAPEIRIQTEATNAITLSSFFEKKFNDTSNHIRIISGLFCLYFFVFYIAAGLVGLGRVFGSAFEINYHTGIILGLIISLLYTLLGGLFAIAWSDLFQGTFLLACIMFVPYYTTMHLGGFSHLIKSLQQYGSSYLSFFPTDGIFTTIIAILSWGLGYFGQPHILINFMGIDNPANLQKSKLVGCSWQILALSSAIAVGIVGKVMFFGFLQNPELIFIVMVKQLFTPFIAGIILCAILAATISTINTQALISSSLITNDLYLPLFPSSNITMSDSKKLLFSRLAIFIIPLFSLIVAWNEHFNILNLVLYAWSGLGSAFGPIVILSLYFDSYLNRSGILAGLIAGGIAALIWPFIPTTLPTLIAGFLINGSTTLVVSRFTK